MLILGSQDTEALLSFDTLIPALDHAFAQDVHVPLRHTHTIDVGAPGTMLIMPAWNRAGYLGVKTINIFPENGKQSLPGLHATYILYSALTGVPLAQLDGDAITAYRTAGAAALGAQYLSREDASHLLIVGSGRIAAKVAHAMRTVRPVEKISIWNVNAPSAHALADQLKQQGLDASVVDNLEAAVRCADIVSCATLSTSPLVKGDWLSPGCHLDLIGSFKPVMRETDSACFSADKRVYVDTDEAIQKSGDLLDAIADNVFCAERLCGTLAQLSKGEATGRRTTQEITVFKAVGTALEDLAAAQLVYEQTRAGL